MEVIDERTWHVAVGVKDRCHCHTLVMVICCHMAYQIPVHCPEPSFPAALHPRHLPRPGSPITTRARGGKAAQCEEEERTVEFSSVGCIIGAAADLGVGAPDPDRSVRGSVWPHLPMNTQDSVCGVRDRSGSENERGAVGRPTSLYSIRF